MSSSLHSAPLPQGSAEAPRLTLAARKHVGKKDVQTIVHCKAAALVAVLSDGLLTLLDAELFGAHLLPGIKVRTTWWTEVFRACVGIMGNATVSFLRQNAIVLPQ